LVGKTLTDVLLAKEQSDRLSRNLKQARKSELCPVGSETQEIDIAQYNGRSMFIWPGQAWLKKMDAAYKKRS